MFGIGFTELIIIAIVAILFIGPDKLPQTMIEIAKFIKGIKQTVGEAKHSLEEEMQIADLKNEALGYKKQLDDSTNELKNFKNISLDDFDDDVNYDEEVSTVNPADIVKKQQHKPEPIIHEETPQEIEEKQDDAIEPKKRSKDDE